MQSEVAQAAYNQYFASGIIPASDIAYIVVILIVAALALWQARTFASKF
ncbi:MAG: hypothetical protein SA339_11640 [Methanomassiliicoccus sp.]|nr:hypothetical protein [Methanomassiliicoccus sp.]